MTSYLLGCDCGKLVQVDTRQAGTQIICQCGAQIRVPALRQLRELPPANFVEGKATSRWSAKNGFCTAALIVAVITAAVGAYFWWTTPTIRQLDAEERNKLVTERLDELSAVEAWEMWVNVYQQLPETGFQPPSPPAEVQSQIRLHRFRYLLAWGLSAVGLVVSVAIRLWPSSRG
jgi:hypothetical protein